MTKTTVMTSQETKAWLDAYFFVKMGVGSDFTEIYTGQNTWIYEWAVDENVEVIETLAGFDADIDDYFYVYTVNFYDNATSGTPYRTGTVRINGI